MNMPGRVRSGPPFDSAQGRLREAATGGASRAVLEHGWASPHRQAAPKVSVVKPAVCRRISLLTAIRL